MAAARLGKSAVSPSRRCVEVLLTRAEVAELADAPDSKSGGPRGPCGFDSHLRHLRPVTLLSRCLTPGLRRRRPAGWLLWIVRDASVRRVWHRGRAAFVGCARAG